MQDLSGQLLKGYELLDRIGAGGFGAVYRARQTTVEREVAVKFILPAFANDLDFIRRFESEANLVARLEHPHIAPLYDFWRDPSGAYLVMRYLRGGSVQESLQDGPYELHAASQLLDQIASALDFAHRQNVIHRDIKPSNMLLDEDGNAYLADFGIAQDLAGINKNKAVVETIVGSLDYMAPEQAHGEKITPRSDIYSLGISLYEMLTGDHPFKNGNSIERFYKHINDPVPEIDTLPGDTQDSVNEIIHKATAKNPKHRYQDVLDMAAAFRALAVNGDSADAGLVESLTRREQEILQLIVEGDTNQEIAQKLYLEISTVKWHISRMYKKLGVRSRVQAIVRARDLDLIVTGNEYESQSNQEGSISVVLPEPLNPYKGLRAFEPADSRDFFGREALVEQLLARLAANGSERFLAIVGPSGSGKSSLIKAGLIPALWQGKIAGSEKWFIIDMQPGARPLDDLEIALTRIAADQAPNLRRHLDRDVHGLIRAAKLILPNDESELLLVIDQFEEIFTLVEEAAARNHYMDLIQGAVSDPRSRVRVIIALRADYYDRPLQYPAFGELVRSNLETLLPLSAGELERAIVYPAQGVGVTFEPGLVATIIEDVNYRPGTLPLLQFALAELFEQREGRTLIHEAYQALGGAAGALARRAEELYQEQDAAGREAIRQLFLRLVSVSEQKTDTAAEAVSTADTRCRVPRTELLSAAADPDQLDEIIDTFANYRLLSLDHDPATRAATVEVAHEAILREWERLRGWLEDSLIDLGLHRQLQRASRDWIVSGGDPSFLVRGARLDSFQTWAGESSLVLSGVEREFLQTSIEQRELRAAAERERQEQEARLERQSNRRLKALVVVMATALLVAIGLAAAAFFFLRQAQEQQRLSTARELAAAAASNIDLDPERSLLLALEAARVTYAEDGIVLPEVEEVLRQASEADQIELTIPALGMPSYSPDGNMLAIGGEEGRLSLWNADTGEQVRELLGHEALVVKPIFSPDGRLLFTGGFDSTLKIWQLSEGRQLAEITTGGPVDLFALNPETDQIAAALRNGDVEIWDIPSFANSDFVQTEPFLLDEPQLVIDTPRGSRGVAYSPDGGRLAILVPGQSISLWDPFLGQQLLEIEKTGDSVGVAFSPDGEIIAASSDNTNVTLWNAWTGEEQLHLPVLAPTSDIQFHSSGRTLVTATVDGTAALWDVNTGRELIRIPGRLDGTNIVSLHPDRQKLATGSDQGMTRIWDLNPTTGAENLFLAAHEFSAHEGEIYDAIYSPDGTQIASTGSDGALRVWDSATGEQLLNLQGTLEDVFFPAYSSNGEWLAAANRDGGVSIWDARSGQELYHFSSESKGYTTVAFSPDGSKLAAAGAAGTATLWDTAAGKQLSTFDNKSQIMRLIYDPDGQRLKSFDVDGYVIGWDANASSQNPLYTEETSKRVCATTLWDAEITQNGRRWAAASLDTIVYVYDADHGVGEDQSFSRLYKIGGHSGHVTGTAFNPDGTLLASSSYDGTVRLWDMADGKELLTLAKQPQPVNGVDFSPDGDKVAAAGADGKISIYPVYVEEMMAMAQSQVSRDLTVEECELFLRQSTCDGKQKVNGVDIN
jgi:WD40 repeat protein/serine/threonine protein kinase